MSAFNDYPECLCSTTQCRASKRPVAAITTRQSVLCGFHHGGRTAVRPQCRMPGAEAAALRLDLPVEIVFREVQDGLIPPFVKVVQAAGGD